MLLSFSDRILRAIALIVVPYSIIATGVGIYEVIIKLLNQ